MKNISILFFLKVVVINCYSQPEPKQNFEDILKEENLKSVKTMYFQSEDTTNSEGKLLFKKDFDRNGKLIKKYLFTFYDVVSYDNTIDYVYNDQGNVIEKTNIHRVLNLDKRDNEYIKIFGDDPMNEKSFFTYDQLNRLMKEVHYTFGNEKFDISQDPANSIKYEYDINGLLIKEIGTTPNGAIIYQNYITNYEYDNNHRKIKKTKSFTSDPFEAVETTTYTYNSIGQLTEERTKDTGMLQNNEHLKYTYDESGRIKETLSYSYDEKKWDVIKTVNYDENGHVVIERDDTSFDYYDNGLIKRELWKSDKSGQVVNFITTYEFY